MSKMKRLAQQSDTLIQIEPPITPDDLDQRNSLYHLLEPKEFKSQFQQQVYRPTEFTMDGKKYAIQMNHCANPFCKNHGLEQIPYKGKNSRYRFSGSDHEKVIICSKDNRDPDGIPTLNCNTRTMSNWSIATEIERLHRINSTLPIEPEYQFHKDTCTLVSTPFTEPKDFYKRGLSTSNSQRYQCKTCKKFTNVLPDKKRSTGYHQQRNDILPTFAMHLTNHVPVSRSCAILGIGRTYYSKLEWLYRCCLEFLEARETNAFQKKEYPEMWIETDKMMYVLNNVRKKGQRNMKKHIVVEKQLPTQVVVSSEHYSRYVFRADVCFDWDVTQGQIHFDTQTYKDDHLNDFLSKNGRFTKYGTHPMPPSLNDTQSLADYNEELAKYGKRFLYVDGLHINHTYTTIAHFWLIKQMVNSKKWRLITDDDASLTTAINRTFADEIKAKDAYTFVCKVNKTLSRKDAFLEFKDSIKVLKKWAEKMGYANETLRQLSLLYLDEQLKTHQFHKVNHTVNGEIYRSHGNNPIEHPLGMKDRGKRNIDCLTDMSHLPSHILAKFIVEISDNSVNSFLQQIRRSISTLERPLVTSRGDGKSYVYSNFNPRYAQMSMTVLRTYYNFCKTYQIGKTKRDLDGNIIKDLKTPAQRIGIADKVYTWDDIIYKR